MEVLAELKKDSIEFNDKLSAELIVHSGRYGDVEDAEVSIWTNAGSAYRFKTESKLATKLSDLGYKEQDAIAQRIAKAVAITVEIEINRELNKLV
jgi:hypothetical protein